MSLQTKTTIQGDGYEIDVELRCRADPGRERQAMLRAGRVRGAIQEEADG